MRHPREHANRSQPCKVVDFDSALFDACPPEVREELLREARLLAGAFAPDGDAGTLRAMVEQLNLSSRDAEMDRAHARRLAAALKRLAETHGGPST